MSDGNGSVNGGEPSFRAVTIEQLADGAGLAAIHKGVCCDRGRVEIHDGERTCVLISKEELDALEEALEILSNTSDVQKMARTIAALTHTVAAREPVGVCCGGGAN